MVLHIENTCYEYLEADNSGGLVNNFLLSRQNEGVLGCIHKEPFALIFLARSCSDGFNMEELTIL